MAVRLEGAVELKKALRKFEPDLAKELNKEMRIALKPVVNTAKGFVPSTASVLTNWQISKRSETAKWNQRYYDFAQVKRGIKYSVGNSKTNAKGFKSLASIINSSAAGAIFETAGRKNPWGQPWNPKGNNRSSRSANPTAGRDFIASANSLSPMVGKGNDKGRLIYRAWELDRGAAQDGVIRAIEKAAAKFYQRTAA